MNVPDSLTFERLLEVLAEKLASKLLLESCRLYPRLMTIEQAAIYLGPSREFVQQLASSGKIPLIFADKRVLLDRLDLNEWIEDNKVGWANVVRTDSRRSRL